MDLYDLLVTKVMREVNRNVAFQMNIRNITPINEIDLQDEIKFQLRNLISTDNRFEVLSFNNIVRSSETLKEIALTYNSELLVHKYNDNLRLLNARAQLEGLREFDIEDADQRSRYLQPDILIHEQKSIFQQHMIFEVKSNDQLEDYRVDIIKLVTYIEELFYRRAYFVFTRETNRKVLNALKRIATLTAINGSVAEKIRIVFPYELDNHTNWACLPLDEVLRIDWRCFNSNFIYQHPNHPRS